MFDGVPEEQAPKTVESLIEESVSRFALRFDRMGMLTIARASGWISDYRQELETLVKELKELPK